MTSDFRKAVRVAHGALDPHFQGRDLVIDKGDSLLPMLILVEYGDLAPHVRLVKFDEGDLEVLVETARESAAEFDAVVELCILRANSGPFEAALKEFHSQLLRGEIQRPKKPGPDSEKYKSRNYVITYAVHSVVLECDLTPYRNSSESGMHFSACDAVAVALGENGYHTREYAAVAKILTEWDLFERLSDRKLTKNSRGKN